MSENFGNSQKLVLSCDKVFEISYKTAEQRMRDRPVEELPFHLAAATIEMTLRFLRSAAMMVVMDGRENEIEAAADAIARGCVERFCWECQKRQDAAPRIILPE